MPRWVNCESRDSTRRLLSTLPGQGDSRYLLCPRHDRGHALLEIATLGRSHLSARHLLQQIETDRSKRAKRDIRPLWLTALVESAAELFDPVAEVGRVGFDCRLDEQGWSATLYLGAVELVGGKTDGQTQRPGFQFDLKALLDRFSRVDDVSWSVLDHSDGEDDPGTRSLISIDGIVGENRVRMAIHSTSPAPVGPGLRRLPNGRFEAI
jgi:hypothetical protein